MLKLLQLSIPCQKYQNRIAVISYNNNKLCDAYIFYWLRIFSSWKNISKAYIRLYGAHITVAIEAIINEYIKSDDTKTLQISTDLMQVICNYCETSIVHIMDEQGYHWKLETNKIMNSKKLWTYNIHNN